MDRSVLDRIRANDHRTLSRIISQIEINIDIPEQFFLELHPYTIDAIRLGITGPSGAGKSTLIDQLINEYLLHNQSVGVVAVDPTSPFTGGALLGDRIRMNRYSLNENVFIRSMGSQGDLGGLTRKTQEVGDILAASGKDVIIFETVGVGQSEHDVAKAADFTIVLLVPESGDEIQLMKAGLIEIADYFVINKSDRKGAGHLAQMLRNLLHTFTKLEDLEPPVINTVANKGEGISDLFKGINGHLEMMRNSDILSTKRLQRYRSRVLTLIQERLISEFWTAQRLEQLEEATRNVESVQSSPYKVARSLINSVANG